MIEQTVVVNVEKPEREFIEEIFLIFDYLEKGGEAVLLGNIRAMIIKNKFHLSNTEEFIID